jgi:hypothetical protein
MHGFSQAICPIDYVLSRQIVSDRSAQHASNSSPKQPLPLLCRKLVIEVNDNNIPPVTAPTQQQLKRQS